jgi:hypothetical protein
LPTVDGAILALEAASLFASHYYVNMSQKISVSDGSERKIRKNGAKDLRVFFVKDMGGDFNRVRCSMERVGAVERWWK